MNFDKAFSDNQEAFGVFNDFDDFNATLGSRDNEREETICPDIELEDDNCIKTSQYVDADQGDSTNVIIDMNSGLSQYSTQVYLINHSEYSGYVNPETVPVIDNTSDYGVFNNDPVSLLLMANDQNHETLNINEQIMNNTYYQNYTNDTEIEEVKNKIKDQQNNVARTNIDPRIFIQGQSCSRRKKLKVTPKKCKAQNVLMEKEKFYYFEKARPTTMKRLRNYFRCLTKENRLCFIHAHEIIKKINNNSKGSKSLTIQFLMDFFQPIIHLKMLNNQDIRNAINVDDIKTYASEMIDAFNKQEKERKNKFKSKNYGKKRSVYKEPDINTKNKILSRIFCRDIQKIAEQINKTPPNSPSPDDIKFDDKLLEQLHEEPKVSVIVDPTNDKSENNIDDEIKVSTPLSNLKKRVELLKKLQKSTPSIQSCTSTQSNIKVEELNESETLAKNDWSIQDTHDLGSEGVKDTCSSMKIEINTINQSTGVDEFSTSGIKKKPKLSQNLNLKTKVNKEMRKMSAPSTPLPYNYSSKNIEDVINRVASFQPDPTPKQLSPRPDPRAKEEAIEVQEPRKCIEIQVEKSCVEVPDKEIPPDSTIKGSNVDGLNEANRKVITSTTKSIKRKPLAFATNSNNHHTTNPAPSIAQFKMAPKLVSSAPCTTLSIKVIKHFSDILGDRIKSQNGRVPSKKHETGLTFTLGKKVEQIAEQIERAMRNTYPYNVTDPADSKYKAKYRALIYNLKDPKNKVYTKLITGEVDATTLVQMSQEDISFYRSSSGLASSSTSKSSFKIPNKANATQKPSTNNGLLGSPPRPLSFTSDYIPTTASSGLSSYNTVPSYRTERNPRFNIKNESPKIGYANVQEEKIFWSGTISFGEVISKSSCAQSLNATGYLLYRTIPNDIEFDLPKIIKCRSRILPEIVISKLKNCQKTALISFESESNSSPYQKSLFSYLSENRRFSTCDDLPTLREKSEHTPAECYIAPFDTFLKNSYAFASSFPKQIIEKLKIGQLIGILLHKGKSVKSTKDEIEPSTSTTNPESSAKDSKTDDVLDFFKSLNSPSLPFGDTDYRIIPPLSMDLLQSKGLTSELESAIQLGLTSNPVEATAGVTDVRDDNGKEVEPISTIPNLDDLLLKVAVSLKTIEKKEQEFIEEPNPPLIANDETSPLQAILTLLNSAGVASSKK